MRHTILNFFIVAALGFFISCSPLDPKPDFKKGFIKYYSGADYTTASKFIIDTQGNYYCIGSGFTDTDGDNIYVFKADNEGNVVWQRYLGGAANDTGFVIRQDSDNNLVVLGNYADGNGGTSIYLSKLDINTGASVFERQIKPNTSSAYGYDLRIAASGGYIIAGAQNYTPTLREALIIKTDNTGEIVNTANGRVVITYSYRDPNSTSTTSNDDFYVNSIDELSNGDFKWVGNSTLRLNQGAVPNGSPIFVNTKIDGRLLYAYNKLETVIAEPRMVSVSSLKKIADGYIAVGNSINTDNTYESFLMKLDADFKKVWYRTYNIPNNDYAFSVETTADGGFIFTGRQDIDLGSGDADVYVIKTDATGSQTWKKQYGGKGIDKGKDIKQTQDGGYAILCDIELITTPANKPVAAIIKVDSEGVIEN